LDDKSRSGIGVGPDPSASAGETAKGGLGPQEENYNSVGNIFYGAKGYLAIDNASGYKTCVGRE
jgi:hypothetical protein